MPKKQYERTDTHETVPTLSVEGASRIGRAAVDGVTGIQPALADISYDKGSLNTGTRQAQANNDARAWERARADWDGYYKTL